jgi:TatD DNase family protein
VGSIAARFNCDEGCRALPSAGREARVKPPLPEPLRNRTVDTHCHLDIFTEDGPAGDDVAGVLAEAAAVGVDRIVQVGCDVESSRFAVECANAWPGQVLAAIAIHPNDAARLEDLAAALAIIDHLASEPRVRAIGETGLDYFRTGESGRGVQEHSFREHIAIAKRHKKTLMIHDRDAHDDVLRILREEGAPDEVIFHCFSGDADMAKDCVASGFILSFAGTVTFSNAPQLREALLQVPLDQLLVETDAPFLTPVPYRGRPNAPYLIPVTIRAIAMIRDEDPEVVADAVSRTATRVFGPF